MAFLFCCEAAFTDAVYIFMSVRESMHLFVQLCAWVYRADISSFTGETDAGVYYGDVFNYAQICFNVERDKTRLHDVEEIHFI